MTRRKNRLGVCLLCGIALSAVFAHDAFAATKGTTAFTCKEKKVKEGVGFSAAHCKAEDAVASSAGFEHVPVAEKTQTEVQVTDLTTAGGHSGAVLKATVAGSAIELVAKEVIGTGTMENLKDPSGEHYVAADTSTKYSGVTENLLGCAVIGYKGGVKGVKGVVETNSLSTTTSGQGDSGQLFPKVSGLPFAEFELTECVIGPLKIKVFGSVRGQVNGATTSTVHTTITGEKTLRLQNATTGPLAGIEVSTTFKGRANSTEPYTPLSGTTVETP